MRGDKTLEAAIHKALESFRVKDGGEDWFRPSPGLMRLIRWHQSIERMVKRLHEVPEDDPENLIERGMNCLERSNP